MIRRLLASVALFATLAAAPASPPAIPIETFAETPVFSRLVLSPDGKRIAAVATTAGKTRLVIFETDDTQKTKLIDVNGFTLAALRWAGPNRLLATVSMPGTKVLLPMTRLVVIDSTTSAVTVLDRESRGILGGDVLSVDPSGRWAVVASQDDIFSTPSVKRIEIATGAVVRLENAREDVWNWFADDAGVVRAGIAYKGERWTMWYRASADAPLKPIRSPKKGSSGEEGAIDGVRFLDDLGNGIIMTNTKTGRFAAYRYDFTSGAIGAAIYENADVDLTNLVSDPATGAIAGVAYTDDRYHVAWFDPQMKTIQAKLDRAMPGREIVILNGSHDGNRLLVWVGAANDPGAYYLYDRAARTMKPIAAPYDKLEAAALAPVAPVKYTARDGLSIHAYLTLPPGRSAKDLPLIVFPHGGPHARDTWDFDPYVQFLASRGYAVLQPNFRGSTGYGKAFVEKGYGQWGRAMQDDVDDGMDWLVKSGQVDPKRVCIMGISYGGYAALWGAIRNPERYRCAVSLAGVTDLPDMLKFDRKSFSAPRYFRAWQTKVEGEDKVDLVAVSPLAQAGRLKIPVLIAHGDKDDNVPVRQGQRMVAALTKNNAPVQSVFYPTAKHGLQSRDDKIDFFKRLEAFLAKNNPS